MKFVDVSVVNMQLSIWWSVDNLKPVEQSDVTAIKLNLINSYTTLHCCE